MVKKGVGTPEIVARFEIRYSQCFDPAWQARRAAATDGMRS